MVAVLSSPIIGADKKEKIINAVMRTQLQPLTYSFIQLLIRKTRESNLLEIRRAVIEQYNKSKGRHLGKLTTATAVSE